MVTGQVSPSFCGGTSIDRPLEVASASYLRDGIQYTIGNQVLDIRCSNPGPGKRMTAPPETLALLAQLSPCVSLGGGATNSALAAADYLTRRNVAGTVSAIHLHAVSGQLVDLYRARRIQALGLTDTPAPTNFVPHVAQTGDRDIIRGVNASPVAVLPDRLATMGSLLRDASFVAINSLPAADLVIPSILASRKPLAAVLTLNLRLAYRVECLARGFAIVANLEEFCDLAAGLDVSCPSVETSSALGDIAQAVAAVATRCRPPGLLAVTLGSRGVLVRELTGALFFVGLRDELRPHIPPVVLAERRCGAGDRWYAAFCLAAWLAQQRVPHYLAVRAALAASLFVLDSLLLSGTCAAPHWYAVRRVVIAPRRCFVRLPAASVSASRPVAFTAS